MGILDDIFGGGGGSTSYEVTSTLAGGLTSTIQGGDRPVAVDVGLNDVNADIDVDMGLDNVNVTTGLTQTLQGGDRPLGLELGGGERPVATTSTVDLAVTEPIVSNITSRLDNFVDVEPLQVDLCVDVGLSKLPRASIRQPYKSHFGVSLLGAELIGFDWLGHNETIIDDLPDPGPKVISGRAVPGPKPRSRPPYSSRHDSNQHHSSQHHSSQHQGRQGLRIRLE